MQLIKKKPILLAISGGSGSGKSTLAKMLAQKLGGAQTLILSQDHYYKDLSKLSPEQREVWNFDHPDAIDARRLQQDLEALLDYRSIMRPSYDFATHTRLAEEVLVESRPYTILDGIFSLVFENIYRLAQVKVFVDVDDQTRLARRMKRDLEERGRSKESVITQYEKTVRPMFVQYIEPSKKNADLVVPWGKDDFHSVQMILNFLKQNRSVNDFGDPL